MQEIRNKRLTLFVLEITILQNNRCITEDFIEQINDFIYNYYEEYKELFTLMFEENLLKEFMNNNYEIVTFDILVGLLKKYHGYDGYSSLVDSVGFKTDQKLNILVIKFLEYYEDLLKLQFASPTSIYQRILQ